jgi:L-seryl-tRNA(Ser) seleniumtransferase
MVRSGEGQAALRLLPSVDEVLRLSRAEAWLARVGRERAVEHVRAVLDAWRAEVLAGALDEAALGGRLERGELAAAVEARLAAEARRGLHRVVNATGVVLHTGLGRAPVHPEVAAAMAEAAASYGTVEIDRDTGERNQRDDRLGEQLVQLSGAEAGIAVNNNAAAVFLVLQTFAGGKEAIVSRGELVEIGGSFRVPDIMLRAGVTLREVGTTNRTRAKDYRAAVGPGTGLMMKVHSSNFRIVGFTEEVAPNELAGLGRELGVPTAFDLGSGLFVTDGARAMAELGPEPEVRDAVASGLDVVTFSGDKLLGGPQAGLLVGRREAIRALRANPIYRAMRLDKVALAGLERTLALYLGGRGDELPARRMLQLTAAQLEPVARRLAAALGALPQLEARVLPGGSQPGSGAAPDVLLDTFVVAVRHARLSAAALARALREGEPPVMARIQEGELLLDPRTLLEGDEERLLAAFGAVSRP